MNRHPRAVLRAIAAFVARATRHLLRVPCWWLVKRGLVALPDAALHADAWVVAPHPDDECLGCGGLVLRKTGAGARVRVVIVGDGSGSHPHKLEPAELSRRRVEEARAACARLGVRAEDVHFVRLADLHLIEHVAAGADQIGALIAADPTPQVVLPYSGEPPPDHRAAWEMGRGALEHLSAPVRVLEYPVWFWDAVPWMGDAAQRGWSASPARVRAFPGHLRKLLRDFRTSVDIAAVLETKRQALTCHETQMRRPAGDADWATLADVSDGDFLAACLRPVEIYHDYVFDPARDVAATRRRESG